jgi:hypothetical protein
VGPYLRTRYSFGEDRVLPIILPLMTRQVNVKLVVAATAEIRPLRSLTLPELGGWQVIGASPGVGTCALLANFPDFLGLIARGASDPLLPPHPVLDPEGLSCCVQFCAQWGLVRVELQSGGTR